MEQLVEKLGLKSYSLYVFDYGAPVGYRLALRHPERVQALLVQNGNAYEEGLLEFWDPIKKYWADPTPENREAIRFLTEPKATRWQIKTAWPTKRSWIRPPGPSTNSEWTAPATPRSS